MYLSKINLSQIPELWQTNVTYKNDLMYEHIPTKMDYHDCMEYLMRKIRTLEKKIANAKNQNSLTYRNWMNQRDIYAAIVKYLSLRKQV